MPRRPVLAVLATVLAALLGVGAWAALSSPTPPDVVREQGAHGTDGPGETGGGTPPGSDLADPDEPAEPDEPAGTDDAAGTDHRAGPDGSPQSTRTLAFLGDSLTVGVGAGPGESFAWRTAEVLDWPVVLVDGVSGSGYVAPGGGRPFPERVRDLVLTAPDVVVVVGGNNDIFQGLPADEVRAAAREVFAGLREGLPDADVVVVGPFPNRLDEVRDPTAVRASLESAAAQAGVTWLDPRDLLAEELADPTAWDRYLSPDGVHPNAAGYRLIGDALAERLPGLVG